MKAIVLLLLSILALSHGCTLGTLQGCTELSYTGGITSQIIQKLVSFGYSIRALDPSKVKCENFSCFLDNSAADALEKVAQQKNEIITLSGAYLSAADEYIQYRWYLDKLCNTSRVAVPGMFSSVFLF